MADQEFLYKDLTYAIIGAAMEAHRILGPGFLESVYEEALTHEFDLREIPYQRQAKLAVRYKEIVAGDFRADFLVDGKVVIELKAIKALTEGDEAQLLNYPSTSPWSSGTCPGPFVPCVLGPQDQGLGPCTCRPGQVPKDQGPVEGSSASGARTARLSPRPEARPEGSPKSSDLGRLD